MTSLRFEGGPKAGDTYTLEPGQSPPTEYRHTGWSGRYVYVAPDPKSLTQFAPHFLWRGR